jgi:acetyltransferase-like isoleucine patch superfamily enzyme
MGISVLEIIRKIRLRYSSEETVNNILRKLGMRIGKNSRVYTLRIPGEAWLVRIGDNCAIGPDVTFVTHNANTIFQHKYETLTGFGCIDLKDNTYVGGADVRTLAGVCVENPGDLAVALSAGP